MSHLQQRVVFLGQLYEDAALIGIQGERLFQQDWNTAFQELRGDRVMSGGRDDNRHRINFTEQVSVVRYPACAALLGDGAADLGAGVGHGD